MTDEGWMPPTGAPAIPEPPYYMTPESKYMYAFYDRPDDVLAPTVPAPLELAPSGNGPRVRVVVGDPVQPPHTHTPYHEGIVSVRVTFEDRDGWYHPYIWTDNDTAMDAGRLYGWYKQLCDDTPVEFDGNRIKGVLSRNGDPLYRMSFRSSRQPTDQPDAALEDRLADYMSGTIYGVKKIPSPERGGKVLKQVVDVDLEDAEIHEIWEGEATVEFFPNASYPGLHRFEPAQEDIVAAFYVRPEFVLPYAEVVWERYE